MDAAASMARHPTGRTGPIWTTGESGAADDRRRSRRVRAMMEAAHALFLEKGFEATTMGEIVARSGGSLSTLYANFGNKTGLLIAMVAERCAHIQETINAVALRGHEPADVLREIARLLYAQIADEANIALFRVVMAEMLRMPELGQQFWQAGPASSRRMLAHYFAELKRIGTLDIGEPEAATTLFLNLLFGEHYWKLLCGIPHEKACVVSTHIDAAVHMFMRISKK